MKDLKLFLVCFSLLVGTDPGQAKPKDIHIHLHGIGREVATEDGSRSPPYIRAGNGWPPYVQNINERLEMEGNGSKPCPCPSRGDGSWKNWCADHMDPPQCCNQGGCGNYSGIVIKKEDRHYFFLSYEMWIKHTYIGHLYNWWNFWWYTGINLISTITS